MMPPRLCGPAQAPDAGRRHRNLPVDFFRGLSLLMVFLIHTCAPLLLWLTTCRYGFSDPAEAFVFLSGYTAGLVSGTLLRQGNWRGLSTRMLRQAGRVYVGHLALTALVLGGAALAWRVAGDAALATEMHLDQVLEAPGAVLVSALRLQFRPANLDVLPLFVVLFLAGPAVLIGLRRWPAWTVTASVAAYTAAQLWQLNLAGYAGTVWFFNPFAWQVLFCLGAACGLGLHRPRLARARGPLTVAALAVVVWSALVTLRWYIPALPDVVPGWLAPHLYPISKTDLAPVRLLHFLALAYLLGVRWPVRERILASRVAQAVIACGQHSLTIFGEGVLLSAGAELALHRVHSVPVALGIALVGVAIQCGTAALLARRGAPRHSTHSAPGTSIRADAQAAVPAPSARRAA